MEQSCENQFCGQSFVITLGDSNFYQTIKVSTPKLCPDCRQQRRLAFRNERRLYHNTCALCKKRIISIYSADTLGAIYCPQCWWSDSWDPINYAQDFDFSKGFFEQFKLLWDNVPKLGLLMLKDCINSEYSHDVYGVINCYLVFDGAQSKDCFYGETFLNLRDCVDFLFLQNSELCYETINCSDCYNLDFSQHCQNCSDSRFLLNCKGCRNCFGCVNLRQKEYYIFNKPYSKEEYHRILISYGLFEQSNLEKMKNKIQEFFKQYPRRMINGEFNENVSGDNLLGCKDTFESYDSTSLRDSKFCTNMLEGGNDCYDINLWGGNTSLAYNSAGIGSNCQNIIASYYVCFNASDIYHSAFCLNNVKNLLGCVGLRQKQYCILNKQYSKEEYEKLVPKIIESMKTTIKGGWGEFFPPFLSPFGYNQTVAQEYFPLTKQEALERGFHWKDTDIRTPQPQTFNIPDDIQKVPDSIVQFPLACEQCKKNFKIIPQELKFCRNKNLPLPRKCPDCRHLQRLASKNPRRLQERTCAKCEKKILTANNSNYLVYCQACFSASLDTTDSHALV